MVENDKCTLQVVNNRFTAHCMTKSFKLNRKMIYMILEKKNISQKIHFHYFDFSRN